MQMTKGEGALDLRQSAQALHNQVCIPIHLGGLSPNMLRLSIVTNPTHSHALNVLQNSDLVAFWQAEILLVTSGSVLSAGEGVC